ncbi:MAG: YdcF family protein [Candidatus Limnocylindrales bacterium]
MPRSLRGDLTRLLLAALALGTLLAGYTTFRIWQEGDRDDQGVPVDVVVVLGAAEYNGVPSDVFRARLSHAVQLVLDGAADHLLVTGGKQPGDRFTEAAVARAYAIEHGIPAAKILSEKTGRDTRESLTNAAAVMRSHGLTRALFVSDRTHMLRVMLIAEELGIDAHASPTTTSPTDIDPQSRLYSSLRELAAIGANFFVR